jgi:hypothetical protein
MHPTLLMTLIVSVAVTALVAIVYLVVSATRPVAGTFATPAPAPTVAVTTPPAAVEPPPATPPVSEADSRYRITGIMKNPEGKFGAVINGKVVYEEYYVDGATVKHITQDRVTLDINGREAVVRLY